MLQSAAFHHYKEAYTRPFHDIRLQLSQNQRYCTNIEKAQKGVVTQTVAFRAIVKLHFLRAADIVPYCATQPGQCQYCTIRLYRSATKQRLCHREMASTLAEPTFQRRVCTTSNRKTTNQLLLLREILHQHLNTVPAVCQELYQSLLTLLFNTNEKFHK